MFNRFSFTVFVNVGVSERLLTAEFIKATGKEEESFLSEMLGVNCLNIVKFYKDFVLRRISNFDKEVQNIAVRETLRMVPQLVQNCKTFVEEVQEVSTRW